jgi:hypothetical protein
MFAIYNQPSLNAANQQAPANPPGRSSGPRPDADRQMVQPPYSPLPGQKYRVHQEDRPMPQRVTPGLPLPSPAPPSDAVVLFNGKDLSQWRAGRGGGEPQWKIENADMIIVPQGGSVTTKQAFGDCQMHVEWMVPKGTPGDGQGRGNSGVTLMGRYEIQILDDNKTYADGIAGAIYGLWPPMVNPIRPQGEWNSYDIFFEAPRFDGDKVANPAYITLLFNGVLVHNHAELIGATSVLPLAKYTPHAAEESLTLQNHGQALHFRNIWIRKLSGYTQQ